MKKLLFTMEGRIPRKQFWFSAVMFAAASALVWVLLVLLWQVIPGTVTADGSYHVEGVRALPYIALVIAYLVFCVASGICVNAKRCHDRGKSGWFMLIQFVPLIGGIWYLIETGFLRGTPGRNRFGPDPLGRDMPFGSVASRGLAVRAGWTPCRFRGRPDDQVSSGKRPVTDVSDTRWPAHPGSIEAASANAMPSGLRLVRRRRPQRPSGRPKCFRANSAVTFPSWMSASISFGSRAAGSP